MFFVCVCVCVIQSTAYSLCNVHTHTHTHSHKFWTRQAWRWVCVTESSSDYDISRCREEDKYKRAAAANLLNDYIRTRDAVHTSLSWAVSRWFCSVSCVMNDDFCLSAIRTPFCCSSRDRRSSITSSCSSDTFESYSPSSASSLRRRTCFSCSKIYISKRKLLNIGDAYLF